MRVAGSESFRKLSALERIGAYLRKPLSGTVAAKPLRAFYRWMLTELSVMQPMESVLPGGERIRLHPAYRYLTWNSAEYDAFRKCLSPGDTAIDIGANIGAYSLAFAKWVGDTGRVLAVEPSPEAYRGLTTLLGLNGVEGTVTTLNVAVTDEIGEVSFVESGASGSNHVADSAEQLSNECITVPSTTVDTLVKTHAIRPKLIKIDVEGHELDVLKGARETIAAFRGDMAIFAEMHPQAWRRMGFGWPEVEAELRLQRLQIESLPGSESVTHPLEGECVRLRPA